MKEGCGCCRNLCTTSEEFKVDGDWLSGYELVKDWLIVFDEAEASYGCLSAIAIMLNAKNCRVCSFSLISVVDFARSLAIKILDQVVVACHLINMEGS